MEDPLAGALPFVQDLNTYCADRLSTHVLSAGFYLRKGKPLLALKSLLTGLAIDSSNQELRALSQKLLATVGGTADLNPHVKETIQQLRSKLPK
eukprot:NODE_7691_length_389_cov_127.629412_g5998_i0.p2 GENE.NODE_7691_length_389_cov_127.629412_g5998_i0~~NODE_7691_length_389_cov_127.629412_g5998_i0.p2  ORF type:complete len:107 (-),score=50.35 NODE_7691_length_389_cov_127.629412_g5998_i0:67-348(-)